MKTMTQVLSRLNVVPAVLLVLTIVSVAVSKMV